MLWAPFVTCRLQCPLHSCDRLLRAAGGCVLHPAQCFSILHCVQSSYVASCLVVVCGMAGLLLWMPAGGSRYMLQRCFVWSPHTCACPQFLSVGSGMGSAPLSFFRDTLVRHEHGGDWAQVDTFAHNNKSSIAYEEETTTRGRRCHKGEPPVWIVRHTWWQAAFAHIFPVMCWGCWHVSWLGFHARHGGIGTFPARIDTVTAHIVVQAGALNTP